MKRILFVCTGNTCRSPMAQGILQTIASEEGLQVDIRSAGVFASEGTPISSYAEMILKERGYNETLRSSRVTDELMEWADLILTMTMQHKQHVTMQYPESIEKVFTLKEYVQLVLKSDAEQKDREKIISELQIKKALGEQLTKEQQRQWEELQDNAPDYDIADPFGGSEEDYRQSAHEIEHALYKLVQKLKNNEP